MDAEKKKLDRQAKKEAGAGDEEEEEESEDESGDDGPDFDADAAEAQGRTVDRGGKLGPHASGEARRVPG